MLGLTFGVAGGLTMSGPGETRASIFQDNFNPACPGGFGAGKKKIGAVTAIREKGLATFRGKLHGAVPGGYMMKLYDSQCSFLLKLDEFNVDGSGDGDFAAKAILCPGQTYFLDFQYEGTGTHNSTPFFKLGSSGPGQPPCPITGIRIITLTNSQDANSPTGPIVAVGSTVTWTYIVTNTGNVPLKKVVVTDDHLGTVTSFTGDSNGNGLLDPNETWTYTATGTAGPDQYANVGTATGKSAFGTVADDDPSHYLGSVPGINIVKYTNGADANTLPGPAVTAGSTVTWTYVVTNTGNVPLNTVAVTDDVEGTITSYTGDTNGNGELDLSETWTYTKSDTAVFGPYSNLGTVTADSPISEPVTDSDPSNYTGDRIIR